MIQSLAMIGQLYSSSQNACVIKFIDGPYHGQSGLYDHDKYNSIQFGDSLRARTHVYEPDGPRQFRFSRTLYWNDDGFELTI